MAIHLDYYRVFREVAACKSISKAARKLYISQSAVSQSIQQLEKQLGMTLFLRTAKGVQLTGEGQLLEEYASSALALLEAAEEKLTAVKNLSYGTLKIGASDTISRYLLPRLERFSRLYPEIRLQIVNRTTMEALALLKSGTVDIAFLNLPVIDNEITIEPYLEVQDIFVAAKGSQWERQTPYSPEELAALPLILLERKSNSRVYVEDWFAEKGLRITPEIELGSHDLMLEFARIRLGVCCVIREFSKEIMEQEGLTELPCRSLPPARQIGIATLRGVTPSEAARRFIEM